MSADPRQYLKLPGELVSELGLLFATTRANCLTVWSGSNSGELHRIVIGDDSNTVDQETWLNRLVYITKLFLPTLVISIENWGLYTNKAPSRMQDSSWCLTLHKNGRAWFWGYDKNQELMGYWRLTRRRQTPQLDPPWHAPPDPD